MVKPKRNLSVAVIGEFFVDQIFTGFNYLPKFGEEAFARKYAREIGGGAAITACALAKLGLRVAVLGMVGRSDGDWVIERLTSFGVDCRGLEFEPQEPTGTTVSISTREDRTFYSYYGANRDLPRLLRQPETVHILKSARHVHFACAPSGEIDLPLFKTVHRRSRISIDVQSHESWLTLPESLNILRNCDIFFPNEKEAGWISCQAAAPDMLRALGEKGIRGVALKLGGKGAALLWRGRQFRVDPFAVETLDTTGAGDCFNAGFIFAWLHGYRPQRCLEIANICGALSTRGLGGIAAFPTLPELREYESHLDCKKCKK